MTTTRKRKSTRKPTFSWANLAETQFAPILDTETYALPTISDWARFFNVNTSQIYRWREKGIPEKQADRIAVKYLRLHPSLIWPEWFDTAPK
jgi:hypothetical protein